ncbi:hypothetical protein KQI42_15150 [Tissierella sp. MSJ-40]|uniref:Uncharacterized protein n=1 Tax=Tissierella simiarum TaxID=2841534 RepID=A0ABS6EAC2_9FIRM|nr:DUF6709 family protein [Tissierella simiarum]MBU5439360.1 hypothetical protein [Tissierella simiarum]
MNNEYVIERKKVITRLLSMLLILTIVVGVILGIGVKRIKKDAEGPKDLLTLDFSKSKGEFVKASFDRMTPYFAEYVMENTEKDIEFSTKRLYFYLIDDKLMVVQIPHADFREFDKLVDSSNNGEIAVENPIERKGRIVPLNSQVKGIVKDILSSELNIENVTEEDFSTYIWSDMMDVDIPKEIGEDDTGQVIKSIGSMYLFLVLMVAVVAFSSLSKLKRKYKENA